MGLLMKTTLNQLLYGLLGVKQQEEVDSEDQHQPEAEDLGEVSPKHLCPWVLHS